MCQVISRSPKRTYFEQFQCDNDRKLTVCWSDCRVTGATVKVSLNEGYSKILVIAIRLVEYTCNIILLYFAN